MTVYRITSPKKYIGLSTDTKPTTEIPPGSTFFEYDTGVLYVCYDGTLWAAKSSVSFLQATTIDLQQVAGPYDLYTATTGYVYVERFSIKLPNVNVSDDATITSIKIDSDSTPAVALLTAAAGAKAKLLANAEFIYATPFMLATGEKIILTIAGGASDAATVCTVKCRYTPVVAGAYLAV